MWVDWGQRGGRSPQTIQVIGKDISGSPQTALRLGYQRISTQPMAMNLRTDQPETWVKSNGFNILLNKDNHKETPNNILEYSQICALLIFLQQKGTNNDPQLNTIHTVGNLRTFSPKQDSLLNPFPWSSGNSMEEETERLAEETKNTHKVNMHLSAW